MPNEYVHLVVSPSKMVKPLNIPIPTANEAVNSQTIREDIVEPATLMLCFITVEAA
jgi:hypothetical protein